MERKRKFSHLYVWTFWGTWNAWNAWCIKMSARYVINVNGNIIRLKIINLARNYSIRQRGLINQFDLQRFFSLIHFRMYTRVSDGKHTLAFEINLLIHLFRTALQQLHKQSLFFQYGPT